MLPTSIIKTALIVIPLIAFIAGGIWVYRKGQSDALVNIERQNNAAGNASDNARNAYTRCADRGWMFDFATSKCAGPKAGSGN